MIGNTNLSNLKSSNLDCPPTLDDKFPYISINNYNFNKRGNILLQEFLEKFKEIGFCPIETEPFIVPKKWEVYFKSNEDLTELMIELGIIEKHTFTPENYHIFMERQLQRIPREENAYLLEMKKYQKLIELRELSKQRVKDVSKIIEVLNELQFYEIKNKLLFNESITFYSELSKLSIAEQTKRIYDVCNPQIILRIWQHPTDKDTRIVEFQRLRGNRHLFLKIIEKVTGIKSTYSNLCLPLPIPSSTPVKRKLSCEANSVPKKLKD